MLLARINATLVIVRSRLVDVTRYPDLADALARASPDIVEDLELVDACYLSMNAGEDEREERRNYDARLNRKVAANFRRIVDLLDLPASQTDNETGSDGESLTPRRGKIMHIYTMLSKIHKKARRHAELALRFHTRCKIQDEACERSYERVKFMR